MPKKAEYKVVSGSEREIEVELAKLNMGGAGPVHWQPILMTSVSTPKGAKLFVLVEHSIAEGS